MYISKINMYNFRSFAGKHTIDFNPGINFFVGNNNSGKTTVFKAVEFIQKGKSKSMWITKGREKEEIYVEITVTGDDLDELVQEKSLKKYENYVFEMNNTKNLRLRRDSEGHEWTDSRGKSKLTEIKNILVWNPNKEEWQNPSGIDSTISSLFDAQFVYSDLKNEDYQDFGKTKIVGKLINSVTQDFQQSEVFLKLRKAHKEAFGDDGLVRILNEVQENIESIMTEQYGETGVKFNFGLPELDNFFKTGQILLLDNGVETEVSEKGTGMQRALAMALIQLYANSNQASKGGDKPILFFIDEPETFLHPSAQDKLIESLKKISKTSQIFVTTHSPYLLKHFNKGNDQINIFSRHGERISANKELDLLPSSPTWGEINYIAFGMISVEFHNELYAYLYTISKVDSISRFEKWLKEGESFSANKMYNSSQEWQCGEKTLPTYIRSLVDHPESLLLNDNYTTLEMRESIDMLIKSIKKHKSAGDMVV
ncbi:ATP-dependent endonuclease [Latilactobacillus curvatus]|uniref:ATP-dependent nuclease n=1 Tax=Latilactobacillus curvatus TaxID=28038 RepID=UPI00345F13BE